MGQFAAVLALVAAAIHVYIFVLESMWWTSPRGRAVFGTTETEAAATRELAFNQGFYNLFLAVIAAVGAVTLLAGATTIGPTLVVAGCGSMVAAGLVLLISDRTKTRPALVQLGAPLIALVALAISAV
jgi:putative membrane protein